MEKILHFSPELKRKISALLSIILVISAILFLALKNTEKNTLLNNGDSYYELIKHYVQTKYIEAYADYFDIAYVEELEDYNEKVTSDGKNLEATFVMKAHYRYPYRDPDTVPKIQEAHEKGDMAEYKRLYDEYNQIHNADYSLKFTAEIEGDALKNAVIYSSTEDKGWIRLENGFKDYITEE